MKIVNKTKDIMRDNSGETMVEVMVAFTLLSIMLLIFAQGISFATNTEMRASKSRNSADQALISLQKKRAGLTPDHDVIGGNYIAAPGVATDDNDDHDKPLIRREGYRVNVDGEIYEYYVYDVVSP